MANAAQCYYCFECLSASFSGREPVDLVVVEELWERHEQAKKLSALQKAAESDSLQDDDSEAENEEGAEQDLDDDERDTDADGDDNETATAGGFPTSTTRSTRPDTLKLPNIKRLQSQIPSPGSSSVSTTPSVLSSSSGRSLQSGSTAATTPSGPSDATGPPRRQRQPDRRYPLFVTWNTLSKNGHRSLRGCIGTFEAQELSAGLKSYALTSAFDDTRFSPIPASLLPSLSCALTLLGSFEPCTNAMDWILGVHGIRISFIHRGRRYGATYLPDVPVEQGWTKEETIESLMRKAGWDGPTGGVARRFLRGTTNSSSGGGGSKSTKPWDQVSDFRAVKYQGLRASASYAEWQEWRKWILSLDEGSGKLLLSAA